MSRHERFIDFAKQLAITEAGVQRKKTYHAAVIVKGGKVLSWGLNSHRQPKLFRTNMSSFTHAEVDAVQNLLRKNKKVRGNFKKHRRWYDCSYQECFEGSKGLPE